jgi:very-short-patch-repair endonuclease
MMRIYNQLASKEFRKTLRKNLTKQERKVWNLVRNRQILSLKFFRQYSIGPYTADFYCPELHFAIEIDGGQHNNPEGFVHDRKRTQYFQTLKIKIIRFWNSEVDSNLEGVYEEIYNKSKQLKS